MPLDFGHVELHAALSIIYPGSEHINICPIPEAFRDRPFWKYVAGEHSRYI